MKWRAEWRGLLPQKLQKVRVVLCASSNEGHRVRVCRSKFDIFAAVIEPGPVLVRHQLIQLRHSQPFGTLLGLCDVDEERLIGGAREGAEGIVEVVFACGTICNE